MVLFSPLLFCFFFSVPDWWIFFSSSYFLKRAWKSIFFFRVSSGGDFADSLLLFLFHSSFFVFVFL